jgi:hypothetical protein
MRAVKILLGLCFVWTGIVLQAQVIQTEATLSKNECLIGDQLQLKLTLSKPKDKQIYFPVISDSIGKSIELINSSSIDTIFNQNNQLKLQQTLTITSFDTGAVTIPPLAFIMPHDSVADTIFSNTLTFTVHALAVDTTKKAIYDIKPPLTEPFNWKEILNYVLWGLLAVVVLAVLVYIYLRVKNKKPIIPIPEKPKEPAYVIAFRELEHLKEKKLWQKQLFKHYYSELTDILRKYLENQFNIPAMESISEDIIHYLKQQNFNEELIRNTHSLLLTADFVKFAKAEPLPDENDWHLKNAFIFIEKTKPQTVEEEHKEKSSEPKGGPYV